MNKDKERVAIIFTVLSVVLPIAAAILIDDKHAYISRFLQLSLFVVYGFSIFAAMILSVATKLSWDNDGQYVARITVSANIMFTALFIALTIYFGAQIVPCIIVVIACILSVVSLWIVTDKREIIT